MVSQLLLIKGVIKSESFSKIWRCQAAQNSLKKFSAIQFSFCEVIYEMFHILNCGFEIK